MNPITKKINELINAYLALLTGRNVGYDLKINNDSTAFSLSITAPISLIREIRDLIPVTVSNVVALDNIVLENGYTPSSNLAVILNPKTQLGSLEFKFSYSL